MDLNQDLSDAHNEESSTPTEAQAVNEADAADMADTTLATSQEPVVVEPLKRGKKGKYQGQTGPRSKKGKESSRNNCVMTHGLRAKKLLMPFEDPKEYEKHLSSIIKTLKPQDSVEDAIVDAYAYAIWSSPRAESYQQSRAKKQHREFKPGLVAQSLDLHWRYQKNAPSYLLDIEYEISAERMQKANHLSDCFEKVRDSMDDGDPNSLEWAMALEHYRELFDALDEWLVERGDEITVYDDDGKTLHPHQIDNPRSLWETMKDFNCFLYFESNFMDLKPQIALHLERIYWDNVLQTHLGFTDHFQRTQKFAFTKLEHLATYRKMKKKFENLQDDEVEVD